MILSSLFERVKSLFKTAEKKAVTALNTKTITFTTVTGDPADLTALPPFNRQDPREVAAMTVLALCRYTKNQEECFAMLNDLRGPDPLSNIDKEFIRDRFADEHDYVMRSYFVGAKPDNDYTPSRPLQVKVIEQSNSFDNTTYARLWIQCGGSDSPRQVTLRKKPSTGEWFVNQHQFLLAGIRLPKSQDKWA